MTVPFLFAILAPVAGGVLLILGPNRARMVAAGGLTVVATGRIFLETFDAPLSVRGFGADPWRAGIALAIAVLFLATVSTRALTQEDAPVVAGLGAAIAVPYAEHLATAALFIVLTGAGLAARAWLFGTGRRIVALVALGDVAAVAALWAASGGGARVAPEFVGPAGALAAIASLLFLVGPAAAAGGQGDALTLGAVRAHGVLFAAWIAASGGWPRSALTLVAAFAAVFFAYEAGRTSSWRAALSGSAALVAVGFGVGTTTAIVGGVLLAAGITLATAAALAGERAWAAPSLGITPIGATFAGAVLVVGEAMARAVADLPFFFVALPALAALLWLGQAAMAMHPRGQASREGRLITILVALLAAAGVALLPGTVADAIAGSIPQALTGLSPVGGVTVAVGDRLGLAFFVSAIAALVMTPTPPRVAIVRAPMVDAVPPPGTGVRTLQVALGALVVAALLVIPAFMAGTGRGFL